MAAKRSPSYLFLIVVAHLLFWVAVYFVPFILSHAANSYAEMFAPKLLINHALLLFVFYFNAYLLQTKWQKKTGVFVYIISLLAIVALCVLFTFQLQKPPEPPIDQLPLNENLHGPPPGPDMFGPGNPGNPGSGYRPTLNRPPLQRPGPPAFVLMMILITTISVLYRIIVDKMQTERETREKETETLKTELSFLRSQISPHFIFNALNSTLSLIYKKSDKAADSLVKLSGLMRYMLYESEDEKTMVSKEVEYINDYIELQILRFGGSIKITKDFEGLSENEFHQIEPMLLIPFIENAFKHGVGMITEPEIHIKISVIGNNLILMVENKFGPDENEVKDKNSGIGLANVKRRLDLLYPGKHELNIDKSANWYKVFLKIDLKK